MKIVWKISILINFIVIWFILVFLFSPALDWFIQSLYNGKSMPRICKLYFPRDNTTLDMIPSECGLLYGIKEISNKPDIVDSWTIEGMIINEKINKMTCSHSGLCRLDFESSSLTTFVSRKHLEDLFKKHENYPQQEFIE